MSDFQSPYSQGVLSLIPADEAGAGLERGYTLAWFSPDGFSSLRAGWEKNIGVFLFLRAKPENITGAAKTSLEKKLREFINEPLCRKVRFLWIENPADPLFLWHTHSISVDAQGDRRMVSHRAFLNVRNYAFSIASGVNITLTKDTATNTFFFEFANNIPNGFLWSAAYGEHLFLGIEKVRISMEGVAAGCLQFSFSIPRISDAGTYGYPGLAPLDIGMRIFFRDPEFPESGDRFYLASHRYPFLQEHYDDVKAEPYFPADIQWKVSLDPLYPLSRQRSYFEFIPPAAGDLIAGLPSAFRTNRGYTVHLLPQAGESRLVFTPRPATLQEEDLQEAPFYLVPSGKFEIKVPVYQPDKSLSFIPEANVICGISGLEYVKVTADAPSFLNLVPDQAAYAPAFLSAYALLRDFNAIQKRYQLDISDKARMVMLDEVLATYFPGNFFVSESQRKAYAEIAIVEDRIQWYRDLLKEATFMIARDGGLLSDKVKTAWAYASSSKNVIYYAQPDNAVLHMAEGSSSDFLDYMEVPAMGLPANPGNNPAFPMLPYGNVDPNGLTDIRQMEMLVINPVRRQMIQRIGEADKFSTALTSDKAGNRIGTTPQGLIAKFSADWQTITELQLAKDTKGQRIGFTTITPSDASGLTTYGPALKGGLQSNQLFLVISSPEALQDYFSRAALLANALQNFFENATLETTLRNTLENAFRNVLANPTPESDLEHTLKDTLKRVLEDAALEDPVTNTLELAFENALNNALSNDLDILDWVFELGPEHWEKHGTIMVFKYTDTALIEMVGQPERWFMGDTFNEDTYDVSGRLQQLLSEAIESGNSSDPKESRKYESLALAAAQPNWTGIIMLNVHVPLRGLPNSLKALAGGMNPNLFYSKFIGVEVTQVKTRNSGEQTTLDPQQSSIFGLIDYDNPVVPAAEASGYNFHVPSLSIVFKNSHIVDFAAKIDLILEKIFDEKARLLNSPNNIISMRGVAEEHNGRVTYSFGFSGANRFRMSGKVLEEVEIIKAQFSTDPSVADLSNTALLHITGRFTLWGGIRFAYLQDFDILSFGRVPNALPTDTTTPAANPALPDSLSFGNLEIVMRFDMDTKHNTVENRVFEFDPAKLTVDMVKSGWRKQSLYEQFPLIFRGLVQVRTQAGAVVKTGYMPVNAPIRLAKLEENYYAMKFDLKLGSLGALSGNKPLVVGILVAWNPGKEGLFVGLKLPGSASDKKEIILQGLLKLTFGSVRFVVFDKAKHPAATGERKVGYLLNLKNIKLQFFLLTFPPIGQTEMTLFGDPREGDQVARVDRLLGWYAAYVKK